MTHNPRLAYAQARIQARLSRLPAEGDWQRLAGTRTLSAYLEEARGTGLGEWVKGFSGSSQASALDLGCRALMRELALVTAAWAPPAWRAALEWVGWLPWLPLLEHLARGEAPPDWASRDDQLAGLVAADGILDRSVLRGAGLGELIAGTQSTEVATRWLAAWRARWPSLGRRQAHGLESLVAILEHHLHAYRHGPANSAWGLRESLRERLRLHLHLHPAQPAALFSYLAIILLDLERLRGALMTRAIFAGQVID
jgi:hypothetical protein